VTGHSETE